MANNTHTFPPATPPEAPAWIGYAWAAGGVASATALFDALRGQLDKQHASLLYLPVVVACATRFGFGPAVLGAAGSFVCWNFFFLPPYHTWTVRDPKDWLALLVFLGVALATARLAAQARAQTQEAQAREREAIALQQASAQMSTELSPERILPMLARQAIAVCGAGFCAIYQSVAGSERELTLAAFASARDENNNASASETVALPWAEWLARAEQAHAQAQTLGIDMLHPPPVNDTDNAQQGDIFTPLRADGRRWGVVHVGPRARGESLTPPQQRLLLALANHAAVALAREALGNEAAQAQALREADTLRSTLLSLVSHELRTPLAAIQASAGGLLQGDWDSAGLQEALLSISTESERMGGLVSKLLDLSRLEAGAWRPDKDWCDLVDVLGTALARLPDTESRRVHIKAPDEMPLVRADFVQIAQVLTNLLENALKYSPALSDVCVAINTEGDTLRTDIADNGPGVPAQQQTTIFETFQRLEQHRRHGPSGTGLGLTICRDIVEAHGGRIWVRNGAAGNGAVFSFTLPLPSNAPAPDTAPQVVHIALEEDIKID